MKLANINKGGKPESISVYLTRFKLEKKYTFNSHITSLKWLISLIPERQTFPACQGTENFYFQNSVQVLCGGRGGWEVEAITVGYVHVCMLESEVKFKYNPLFLSTITISCLYADLLSCKELTACSVMFLLLLLLFFIFLYKDLAMSAAGCPGDGARGTAFHRFFICLLSLKGRFPVEGTLTLSSVTSSQSYWSQTIHEWKNLESKLRVLEHGDWPVLDYLVAVSGFFWWGHTGDPQLVLWGYSWIFAHVQDTWHFMSVFRGFNSAQPHAKQVPYALNYHLGPMLLML